MLDENDAIEMDEEVEEEEESVCTLCGKVTDALTYIDDVDHVCDECLESRYEQCEICGEYWDLSIIEVHYVESIDKWVCEHCRKDLDLAEE